MTLTQSATAASCRVSKFGAVVVANLLKDARQLDSRGGPWCRLEAVMPHIAAIAVACGATIRLGPDGRAKFDMTAADLVAIDAAADEVIEGVLPSLPACRGRRCGAPSAGCRQAQPE
jgi:hypothetical protein